MVFGRELTHSRTKLNQELWKERSQPGKHETSEGYKTVSKRKMLKKNIIRKRQEENPSIGACAQSCLTLCNPIDCSSPGSSLHGIFLKARILEWVAISSSRESSQPGDRTGTYCVSCITCGFFTCWTIVVSLRVNHQLVPVLGYHQVVQGDAEEQGLWSLIHLHLNPWSTGWVTLGIVT